jgi:predicted nucleotidyltransferase
LATLEHASLHQGRDPAGLGFVERWPSESARLWLEGFVRLSCADPNIDAVVVIGSAARRSMHARSDLDLLVVFHGDAPELRDCPLDVDVRAFSRASVEEHLAGGHDLLGWAVLFGLVVCERRRYWSRLAASWRDRLPMPSTVSARTREAEARRHARNLFQDRDPEAALELVLSMLTHRARARLSAAGVYPASRPELPAQLRSIGETALAAEIEQAFNGSWDHWQAVLGEDVADEDGQQAGTSLASSSP